MGKLLIFPTKIFLPLDKEEKPDEDFAWSVFIWIIGLVILSASVLAFTPTFLYYKYNTPWYALVLGYLPLLSLTGGATRAIILRFWKYIFPK